MLNTTSFTTSCITVTCATALLATACFDFGGSKSTEPHTPVPVASVTVNLASTTVAQGSSITATAVLKDAAGKTLTGGTVSWSSLAPDIASVDASGTVTGIAPGTATITATSESITGSAAITVLPPPVSLVSVSLSRSTLLPGETATASAVLKDAVGNTLTGRSVSWSSSAPAVASVDGSGLVTAVAPGTAAITATSEGKSGSAAITVSPPPIASVAFTGAQRVKVGDSYTYTATARLANGTVVDRPVTWSVSDPSMGNMIPSGQLTPLHAGSITLQANIDGTSWEALITSYDWQDLSGDGHLFAVLEADIPVHNGYGTAEYPELVIGCSPSGYILLWVNFENFITENGNVWYSFDGGTSTSQGWDELGPDYTSLWYPGNNLETKTFAQKLAAARTFSFVFTEFDGPRIPLLFRVTGLAPHLAALWTACPSTTLDIAPDGFRFNVQAASHRRADRSGQLRIDSQLRRQRGPRPSTTALPTFQPPAVDIQPATRRPQ